MADIDNNTDLVAQVTSHVEMNDNTVEVSDMSDNLVDEVTVGVNDDDMLQNALVGASDTFPGEVQMQYSDESEVLGTGDLINNGIQFITDPSSVQDSNNGHLPESFTANGAGVTFINDSNFVPHVNVNKDNEDLNTVYSENNEQSNHLVEQSTSQLIDSQFIQTVNSQPQIVVQQQVQQSGSAPLGSSQNPIRIIQQGNQYTPVQQLSTDQLQQIMQVVQQQQVGKTVSAGSSVLFNPQTNTRIVYRVIYPGQLHKDGSETSKELSQPRIVSNTPRRAYKKRIKEEEIEKVDGPELSREEKEQRKKMCPKTRSGRVSKPPKHMVKDFKHIHVLDYDEDYDDSDGGYSDFKYSDNEDEIERKHDDDSYTAYTPPISDSTKPKKWKCITCEKAYIGRAGLGRHLKLNPSHGSIDIDGEGEMEPPDPNNTPTSVDLGTPTTSATPNGFTTNNTTNSTQSFSEDSRDSSVSMTYTPTPRPRGSRGRGRGMRGFRGRGAYKIDPETRRRNKLKEIMRECTDEELMEIVLPRLAKVITLWEFLLMKVEKGDPAWPHADDIYKEYEKLHQHVKKLCQEYLEYVIEPESSVVDQSLFQVEDANIAGALGLKTGPHKVRDIADTDCDIQYKYKFLTTNQTVDFDYTNKSILKRTVEVVSPEQIVSPAKKMKQLPPRTVTTFTSSVQRNLAGGDALSISSTSGSKAPFVSKIKILTPAGKVNGSVGVVNQNSTSGSVSSGKPVSLLSHSFSKQSQPSSRSSSSSLSSLSSSSSVLPSPQDKSNSSSQKVLIVSGMNSVSETAPMSSLAVPSRQTTSEQVTTSAIVSVPQSILQTVSSNNGQTLSSDSRIVLHDSVTGTYTVCSLVDNLTNISQASNELPQNSSSVASSQPVILSLPQTSYSQFMQPKYVLNDMNVLNSVPTDTGDFPQVISAVTGEDITQRQVVSAGVTESNITTTDGDSNNIIYTFPNGDPVQIDSSSSTDGNVIYTLTNGNMTQDNVVLTVDPNTMFVSQMDEKHNADVPTTEISNTKQSESASEVVGIINSIDSSPSSKADTYKSTTDKTENWQVVNAGISNGDTPEFINTSQINGNYSDSGAGKFITVLADSSNPASLATVGDDSVDKVNSLRPKSNNQIETDNETVSQEETIQIPATSIFQTEDGLIFIQNPDGSTLQLQGPDGQAASMETVQALLGMDLETSQIVKEENVT